MSRRYGLLIIAAAVLIAAVVGVLAWRSHETRPVSPRQATETQTAGQGPTAESVTRTYFKLLAAGRYQAAKRYMLQPDPDRVPDAGWYRKCRLISIGKAKALPNDWLGSAYGSHSQLCDLLVRYHSTGAGGEPAGDAQAAAILGRKTPTSPWRVLWLGCPI